MIDSTEGVRSDDVLDALRTRGFHLEAVGEHVLVTRDATRLVLPASGRSLPETFVRRLEHSLRPVLGTGWLSAAPADTSGRSPAPDARIGDVALLDAVVDRCPASGSWCAFLPSELTVMGAGATRDDALRDLKAAAAVWLGMPVDQVVLITPDIV